MNEIFIAKIIGPSGQDALGVEWLPKTTNGEISIGGPKVYKIPTPLVPESLRVPNTIISVSFSDPHTITKVEGYEENT